MREQLISPRANIGAGNKIGHGVIIGDGVTIGDDNTIGDYTVIEGRVSIGSGNHLGGHVSIGAIPTNSRLKYEFEKADPAEKFGQVRIGDRNVIREFTNIGLPTNDFTTIENDCYIMPHCHIAHDTWLEDKVILSNHCSPGGHTRILKGAYLGKGVQSHPRTVIGQYSMLGISAVVVRHVLPAVTAVGNPAKLLGANRIGLERNGFAEDEIQEFERLLATEPQTVVSREDFSPLVRGVIDHFLAMVAKGRDSRTLPQLEIS